MIEKLKKNRYLFTVVVAKRAKQIASEMIKEKIMISSKHKPITIALKELEEGKIEYAFPSEEEK